MLLTLFVVLLCGMAIFLILLVLIQRGRGGGLSGAFGGAGGQSAFGAKAGDTFTKITMWTAFIWIVLCTVAALVIPRQGENTLLEGIGGSAASNETDDTGIELLNPSVGAGSTNPNGAAAGDKPTTSGPPGSVTPSGTMQTPAPSGAED